MNNITVTCPWCGNVIELPSNTYVSCIICKTMIHQHNNYIEYHIVKGEQMKWKYKDDERPKGVCYDCKLPYSEFPDFIIPDELWEEINPTYHKGAGLLCPTCIAKRLHSIGKWYPFLKQLNLIP